MGSVPVSYALETLAKHAQNPMVHGPKVDDRFKIYVYIIRFFSQPDVSNT
ncbi:hypothetical protein JCM14036_29210 [Desulfotomaculum defluvii]